MSGRDGLLDTNAAVALIKGKPAVVRERYRQAESSRDYLAVSSLVLFELWYGVAKSSRQKDNTERLRLFMSGGPEILDFEEEDAVASGNLRGPRSVAGTPIGPYDLLIASQALHHGLTLVTANLSEFSRVSDLQWQNWTA